MQLHHRCQGNGPPLVLLHGLFGSNENLGSVARALAGEHAVYALDLRNHGRSPHGRNMDHATLADDVEDTLDALELDRVALLGHSLGGKTAMELALSRPERVNRLIVVDIAPVAYDRRHDQELEAMHSLELEAVQSRIDVDVTLAESIEDSAVRQFLLNNLVRTDSGLQWRIPLDIIYHEYKNIAAAPSATGLFDGPTLFIRGSNSDYIDREAERAIHERFPNARISTIEGASHWVHVEEEMAFLDLVRTFLKKSWSTPDSIPSRTSG